MAAVVDCYPGESSRVSHIFLREICKRFPVQKQEEAAQPAPPVPQPEQKSAAASAADPGTCLSPSQIVTFRDCQARWWFKHGLNLPDPPNSNLTLGRAVHEAIAINFRQKIRTRMDLPTSRIVEAFDAHFRAGALDTVFHDKEQPAEIAAAGRHLVALYMRQAAPNIQPAAVELPVAGTIAGVSVSGVIDLVEDNGTIVDLKTAKTSPNGLNADHALQLATYATLRGAEKVRIDTLVKTKTPRLVQMSRTLTAAHLAEPRKLFPMIQEAMHAGLYVPNRKSMLCSRRNCPFARHCEQEFGGQVKEK